MNIQNVQNMDTPIVNSQTMDTPTKLLIIGGVLLTIYVLVAIFKMKAALPVALIFGGITYVSYDKYGIDLVTTLFAALTVGVLVLGTYYRGKAKTPAEDAPTRKGKKAKAHA